MRVGAVWDAGAIVPDPAPARKAGPYRLLAELGSGGMGTVYRATAPDGSVVAVKVIHAHLADKGGVRDRFAREVDVGRRVRHENVVSTLDAGEVVVDGRPTLFLAMELVEGQTLRALLAELGRVPEDLCLHVGRETARALAAIHDAGALHRDVKPENVLITPDSRIKVMDLGVARLVDESVRLSQTGDFAGSVLYAAPEQFGDGAADARADLYAEGLLLYELATGRHPFEADDVATVIRKQLSERPRRPAELNPQLSPFFEEVVLNLLEKDPERRIDSAADLVGVLDAQERSAWWHGLRARAGSPLRRVRIPRDTPLEGRETELARMEDLFARARDGEGQVLLVGGEAGIGKSRLIDEFLDRASRTAPSFHSLFGSYPPGGAATASGAFSTAYREFFGGEDLQERLATVLSDAPGLAPAFAALLSGAPPPPGVAPLSRDAILHAFALVTRALAADKPVVVVIEDLHLAPELGRAIFASLAHAIAGERVLLIGSARPGPADGWLGQIAPATRLTLRRLTPKELARLLVDLFRSERLAEELGWAIATKSDGNPFFVFELVRSLREERLIAREADGTWVKTGLIRDLHVPSSVLDLVEARVRDLDEIDKDMLEVASCCGFEFDPLLVARALGVEQIPAMKRFAHLEKKHRLVRAVGRRYAFDHHQVQEALYRGLPELLREPYHAKLGEALEALGRDGEREGADAVELCEHFLAGARGEKARAYLGPALAHLAAGYLHDEAIELAQRALSAEGVLEGTDRIAILLRLAASLESRGRHQEDRDALEEALALADADGDASLRSQVRTNLGRLAVWTSDYDAARTWFEQACELAREAGDEARENAALGNLAIVHYRTRRLDEAEPIFRRVRDRARARDDKRATAVATLNLGNVAWVRGDAETARALYESYRDLSREISYREGEALAYGNLGNLWFAQGRLAEAGEHYRKVLEISASIGDRHKIALFEKLLGDVDLRLGRAERARAHMEKARDLAREIGMPREEGAAELGLARVAVETGDPVRARERAERARAIFENAGEFEHLVEALGLLGRILRAEGRDAEAAAHLDRAIEVVRETDYGVQEAALAAERARLPGGDPGEAERLFRERGAGLDKATRMEAAYALFRATGRRAHLEEARAILEEFASHAPAEDRDSVREGMAMHRAIAGD